ncbi:MAG: hypothetical protein ABJN95_12495 [Maribacter sp.]|uniref:hypothetical protein n=1 Tax=Maribacter sp. TaxID=1897614 RepID=UPI0032969B9B
MIPIQKNYLLVLAICFFCLSNTLLAQERVEYRGTLQVDSFTGDAIYEYKIVDKDTILDGPFQLKRSSLEALLKKEDISFLFKGDFKEGSANGPWRFQFGEFQSDSQSKVVDYEYRVLISGTQEEGSGQIKNGEPDGLWTYEVSKIKDSEKEKSLFKSDITFENGVPQQNFQIENEDAILVGRFLRNGLAHDEWSSYDVEGVENAESWIFEEGVLQKIQLIDGGETKEIPVFDGQAEAYEVVSLDARYLKVIENTLVGRSRSAVLNGNLPKLLAANAAYYQKIDGILSKLGTADFTPKFKVQLPYYTMDSVALENTKRIIETYRSAEAIGNSLLNNSHLNILKRSDADARYYYNCAAKIEEDFLSPIQRYVELADQDVLAFIRRDTFIASLWPKGKPKTLVEVASDSLGDKKTFILPNADSFNFVGDNLETLAQLARYAEKSLETIQKALQARLTTTADAATLVALEENLIQQNQLLVTQIDTLTDLPIAHTKALKNIETLADASLSTYASLKDQKEKLEYGETLKSCLAELSALSMTITALPTQTSEIDSLYQDAVWNPFMAVVMDEEVKKRLTTAFNKVLMPYFLKKATDELNCENAGILNEEIQQSTQRMRELRTEETKKLERKLRREKDPNIILQLLNVQPKKADQ